MPDRQAPRAASTPQADEVWATVTRETPLRLLTDDGVRLELLPSASTSEDPLKAVHPGQRVLVRMVDSMVGAVRLPIAPIVVHRPTD